MFRSVDHPVRVGLGTAAIIAMGAVGASLPAWADPSPPVTRTPSTPPPDAPGSPGPSPTPAPVPWGLEVTVTVPDRDVFEGDEVTATVEVRAERATPHTLLRLTAGGRPVPELSRCADKPCDLGRVGWRGKELKVVVTIPKKIRSGKVTLTAEVSGEGARDDAFTRKIEVRRKLDPSPSPSPTKSGSSTPPLSGGGGTSYTPPAPNGSFDPRVPSPNVDLPPVTPPAPSVAPNALALSPQSALRSNDTPGAQELEFERLASTQAAWLSALLVAFALLLTQLRLGRRRARPRGGTHRRS
ncbi:MAG TPA: hypothetical protein VHJ17_09920 [Thermomonospora sp.]|nr:hypothetical protein [Thermomonospora sp.]